MAEAFVAVPVSGADMGSGVGYGSRGRFGYGAGIGFGYGAWGYGYPYWGGYWPWYDYGDPYYYPPYYYPYDAGYGWDPAPVYGPRVVVIQRFLNDGQWHRFGR
jgi:hypothetical protein